MQRLSQSQHCAHVRTSALHFSLQTQVEINTNLLLREEEYFERANEFIPERWLRDDVTTLRAKDLFAMLPFSHGARMCIGGFVLMCGVHLY